VTESLWQICDTFPVARQEKVAGNKGEGAQRNRQDFYTRLHPLTGFFRGNWCSEKNKNPGFSGVFHVFLLYEAAALTGLSYAAKDCVVRTYVKFLSIVGVSGPDSNDFPKK
jgi:hypothetical protein